MNKNIVDIYNESKEYFNNALADNELLLEFDKKYGTNLYDYVVKYASETKWHKYTITCKLIQIYRKICIRFSLKRKHRANMIALFIEFADEKRIWR